MPRVRPVLAHVPTPRTSAPRWAVILAVALAVVTYSAAAARAQPLPARNLEDAPHEHADGGTPTQPVVVRVTAVAGEHVFVEPGALAGLQPGAVVVFGEVRFTVETAARGSASVRIGPARPAALQVGATGQLDGVPPAPMSPESPPATRREARPLAVYRGQWRAARRPADDQRPAHVPLGGAESAAERVQLLLSGSVLAQAPIGSTQRAYGRSELRAQLRARPTDRPLMIDVDAALQLYMGGDLDRRAGSASRPFVRVRALQAVYGEGRSFHAAVGRLRYAAPVIGSLDGASVLSPSFRGMQIGAFGGLVPDPRSGAPSLDAARFGVIAQFEDSTSALRPSTLLVVHGSIFGGQLDERRLNWAGSIFPGDARIGAHLEASLYDNDERFTTNRVELSAAGVDASARWGDLDLGARFDMRRPERSRWLDAQLPPGWLCLSVPAATSVRPDDYESCVGNEARYVGALNARYSLGRVRLALGGTLVHTAGTAGLERATAFGSVRALFGATGTTFFEASASAGGGLLLADYAAGFAAGGLLLDDTLELSGRYRGTIARYRADLGYWNQQRVGLSAEWRGPATLRLDVDAWLAPDVRGLSALLTAVWRVL
ncbi:MAG: hypothetical protein KC668_19260 [Myxococcales bacterium]|nr:hypothetical protein [Myxococcales bacterium]